MSTAPDRDGARRAKELAALQFGIVTRAQLHSLGLTRHQIRNMTGPSDGWTDLSDEVMRLNGAPIGPEQRTIAAVLDAGQGARLASQSAANWWGLKGCRLEPTLIIRVSGSRRGSTLGRVRRVRFLPDRWTTVHRGVPVVRPEFLAMQLHGDCHPDRAERLTDRLWSMRLCSGDSLERFLAEVPLRGVRGSAGLRRYVNERGVDYRPPDSGLESRFDQIVRPAGLRFRRQVDLGGDEQWAGRVDFVHEVLPVVVEIQSELYHTSLADDRADRLRTTALRDAGFIVLEITDTMLWTDPSGTLDLVLDAIHTAQLCCGMRQD